jgi:hypothetical protein
VRCVAPPWSSGRSASSSDGSGLGARSNRLDLDDPIAVSLAVYKAFRTAEVDVALYGGLALAAYGEPRETKDADFAVAGQDGAAGAARLAQAGLTTILAFNRVRFGGTLLSRITLVEGGGAVGLNTVDLVEPRSSRFARAALDRAVEGVLRGEPIRVLSPEDFVLFKVLSTRERDLEDAATVVRALGPDLDRAFIEQEARALAVEILDHDVTRRLARVQGLR